MERRLGSWNYRSSTFFSSKCLASIHYSGSLPKFSCGTIAGKGEAMATPNLQLEPSIHITGRVNQNPSYRVGARAYPVTQWSLKGELLNISSST